MEYLQNFKVTPWCLKVFVTEHEKDFRFWCTIKDLFVIVESVFCFITVLAIIFLPSDVEYWFLLANTIQATGVMLITSSSYFNDINKNTKYERLLYKRREARHEFTVKEDDSNNVNSKKSAASKEMSHLTLRLKNTMRTGI